MKDPSREILRDGDSTHFKPHVEPVSLIGQEEIIKKIDRLIAQVKSAGKPFPHTLLIGEDEATKRAMVHYIAHKMDVKITATSGPAIERVGDLIGIVTNLGEGDVFFMEEIRRLSREVKEFLYSAAEQFLVDFVIDKGPYAKAIKFNLKRFTLIATSSDENGLDTRLRNLFFCVYKLGPCSKAEALQVFSGELKAANITCDDGVPEGIVEKYGDDTAAALRALRKVIKYLELTQSNQLTKSVIEECLGITEHNTDKQTEVNQARDRYISDEVRRKVWRRDDGKCAKCGNRENLEFDHIIPLSKGGSSTVRNVELLCEVCNRKKSDTL